MDDSKLLELASLAAGETYTTEHNPLDRDDLALRLAVRLYFTVQIDEEDAKTYVVSDGGLCVAIESHTTDPLVATRRAIVRAAAEIGRNMK